MSIYHKSININFVYNDIQTDLCTSAGFLQSLSNRDEITTHRDEHIIAAAATNGLNVNPVLRKMELELDQLEILKENVSKK